jgi:hypothetical protein
MGGDPAALEVLLPSQRVCVHEDSRVTAHLPAGSVPAHTAQAARVSGPCLSPTATSTGPAAAAASAQLRRGACLLARHAEPWRTRGPHDPGFGGRGPGRRRDPGVERRGSLPRVGALASQRHAAARGPGPCGLSHALAPIPARCVPRSCCDSCSPASGSAAVEAAAQASGQAAATAAAVQAQ